MSDNDTQVSYISGEAQGALLASNSQYHMEFRPAIVMTRCKPRNPHTHSAVQGPPRYTSSTALSAALGGIRVDHLKPLLNFRQYEADFSKVARKYEKQLEEERVQQSKKSEIGHAAAPAVNAASSGDGTVVQQQRKRRRKLKSASPLPSPPFTLDFQEIQESLPVIEFDGPLISESLFGHEEPSGTPQGQGAHPVQIPEYRAASVVKPPRRPALGFSSRFNGAHKAGALSDDTAPRRPKLSAAPSVFIDHQRSGVEPKWYLGEEHEWLTPSGKQITSTAGSTSVGRDFQQREHIASGTFGSVDFAVHTKTGREVAIKTVYAEKSTNPLEGEQLDHHAAYLREVDFLVRLRHPNVVELREAFAGEQDPNSLHMVMEYIPHDMHEIICYHGNRLDLPAIKQLTLQLFTAMEWLHTNNVVHKDIKLANLLYGNGILKVADFGISTKVIPGERMSAKVGTRFYRAPELLMGERQYTTAIDIWACGMVVAAWCLRTHLAPGEDSPDQMNKIVELLGQVPSARQWPRLESLAKARLLLDADPAASGNSISQVLKGAKVDLGDTGRRLVSAVLRYRPEDRLTAGAVLASPWFTSNPAPTPPRTMFRLPPPAPGKRTKKGRERKKR